MYRRNFQLAATVELSLQLSCHDVKQKEVVKESQPFAVTAAQLSIVAVQFTVGERVSQDCGHHLLVEVGDARNASSRGTSGFASPGTAEQRRQRDRMRHRRARTMRQQRVSMPLSPVASADARKTRLSI
jgi:hypothetical protein